MSDEKPLIADQLGHILHRKPRVLLVDDQTVNIQVMHPVFAKECQVFMATSGVQALARCEEHQPDLVLLDVEMPDMDGYEVCVCLKANELTRHIPVIFVTAHTDPELIAKGLELGAVDFISKPIHPNVLRARARTHLLLKFQSDLLRDMAFQDGLTGLNNRRYFDQQFATEWARASRHETPLSVILLDVDFFKRYNDFYGHLQGDECLSQVGRVIKETLKRATDMLARYGGEEFVCLLPDTGFQQAMQLAEKIERQLREAAIPHAASDVAKIVTVSLGVASTNAASGQPETLLELADQQLYRAKEQGRARVCGAELEPT